MSTWEDTAYLPTTRDEAVDRLAVGLDINPDELIGPSHQLDKLGDGTITCRCGLLTVPRPPDMPTYDGATMGAW